MVDFFDKKHNPQLFTHTNAWCADGQNNKPAYLALDKSDKYVVAEVCNKSKKEVTFVAVDNNIDLESTTERRCDVMLHFDNSVYFVELKDKRHGGWIKDAKEQLISTVNIFSQNHNVANFKRKRAYVCNKAHPYFHCLEIEDINEFRNATGGFKLFVEGEIEI